jgi:hypothetical protein
MLGAVLAGYVTKLFAACAAVPLCYDYTDKR